VELTGGILMHMDPRELQSQLGPKFAWYGAGFRIHLLEMALYRQKAPKMMAMAIAATSPRLSERHFIWLVAS
jgi:hypothetical protein